MKDRVIRFGQSVIDRILRVDNRWVLNTDGEFGSVNTDIIAELTAIIERLSAEEFNAKIGMVDYENLKASPTYKQYKEVIAKLRNFDPSLLKSRAEKLTFWINLYNCLIVDAVITLGIRQSVWEAGRGFFRKVAYEIGGLRYSADDVEHGILRGNRHHPLIPWPQFAADDPRLKHAVIPVEPRVHFTLVCASRSCPIITVYHATDIEEELEMAATTFINGGGAVISPEAGKVSLSRIFKWFRADFGGRGGIIEFVLRYLMEGPEKDFLSENANKVRIEYQEYDWSLNHS
jgi:hypothetical protein